MRPTQHPSNNSVLGAPQGMGIDQRKPLAITRVKYSAGVQEVPRG